MEPLMLLESLASSVFDAWWHSPTDQNAAHFILLIDYCPNSALPLRFLEAFQKYRLTDSELLNVLNGKASFSSPELGYWLVAAAAHAFGLSPSPDQKAFCLTAPPWILAAHREVSLRVLETHYQESPNSCSKSAEPSASSGQDVEPLDSQQVLRDLRDFLNLLKRLFENKAP